MRTPGGTEVASNEICVSGIQLEWALDQGTCLANNQPIVLMWLDTTLAGLMSGVQAMVGTERFLLALQGEGRKSIEADWEVVSKYPDVRDGFKAVADTRGYADFVS